ncbi:hypothetical protein DH2020_002542 [Rehmannia glutinosa]|uniref:Uncharacterized protein n=1 Tax=Rehmannia glutinosa TaxID=99300 RepID=A0ABR0XU82_REHGL
MKLIGHFKKLCEHRKNDIERDSLNEGQFGEWIEVEDGGQWKSDKSGVQAETAKADNHARALLGVQWGVGRLKKSLAGKPPSTMEELLGQAEKQIRVEESTKPEPIHKRKLREEDTHQFRGGNKREGGRKEYVASFTPLSAPLAKILIAA